MSLKNRKNSKKRYIVKTKRSIYRKMVKNLKSSFNSDKDWEEMKKILKENIKKLEKLDSL